MTSLSLIRPASIQIDFARIFRTLFERQRTLATYGIVLLALSLLTLALPLIDHRLIDGVGVWDKPTKFLVSVAVFALTNAWFFGYVAPEQRGATALRAVAPMTMIAGSFELAYIGWQAAHGLPSHFNRSSAFYEIMYGLMGLGAVALVGTTLPLAWSIARHPLPALRRDFVAAVVIGLMLCFVLGGGLGMYMAQQTSHSVGQAGGHLPLFGWNRAGGDLRIAHFLGIHAEQAMPLLGFALRFAPPSARWPLLATGTSIYVAVTIAVFIQALDGISIWSM